MKKCTNIVVLVSFVVALTLTFGSLSLLSAQTIYKKENIREFTSKLEMEVPKLMKTYDIPGVAVAVIHEGKVQWVKGFGVEDKTSKTPITNDTVFQVGSISKTFTALGIMRLVEQGKIDLDVPVEQYLKRWNLPESDYNEDVTIRGILSHTAGLSVHGYAGYNPQEKLMTLEGSLMGKTSGKYEVFVEHQPRTSFLYSGGGYTVLQLIIEEVTGKPFEEYMYHEVLFPLGMENSSYVWESRLQQKTSKAYGIFGEVIPNYLFIEKAAAGLYTTVDDMSNFVLANIDVTTENKVVSKEMLDMMHNPEKLSSGKEINYGLGYFIEKLPNGKKLVYHGGVNRGWCSTMDISPETKDGIVIMTNSYTGTYLINDLELYWLQFLTGRMPEQFNTIHKFHNIVFTTAIVLIIILVLYILRFSKQIISKKRTFITQLSMKLKWIRWIRIILPLIIFTAWILIFYTPWYNNGWTIAPFLPWGFGWLTTTILSYSFMVGLTGLYPKTKSINTSIVTCRENKSYTL